MIIDTSNAPCGPGFLPGLRLSEGRFAINRKRPRFRGWGSRRRDLPAFVPPSADLLSGTPGAVHRGPAGPPCLPLRRLLPPLSPSFSGPPRAGEGRPPSGPHESGAAAGGRLHVSVLTALRVRRFPCGGTLQRGSEGLAFGTEVRHGCGPGSPLSRVGALGRRTTTAELAVSLRPRSHAQMHSTTTSDQTRQPAEFKHITKRRKRN